MRLPKDFICITAVVAQIVAMAPGSQAGETGPPPAQITKQGRLIAEANCVRCHAIESNGKSTHDDAPPFRDIVNRYSPWLLAEAFAEGITTGHNDMPAFRFDPDEITALLSYMESLEK